jgi:hypothetical protein
MTFTAAYGKKSKCAHPAERVTIVTTGSMSFDGEPWDDFDTELICLDCGLKVEPDQVAETESEHDFIPI